MKWIIAVYATLLAALSPQISNGQNLSVVAKNFCPYGGIANKAPAYCCPQFGAFLPKLLVRSFTANLLTGDRLTLKQLADEFDSQTEAAPEALAGAGLLAGTIGFFAGGFIGAAIDEAGSDGYEEWDGVAGFILGAPIGESLLLPVGVHLANGRRGNFPLSLLASVGITGAGILVAATAEEPYVLLSIPILQLAACTAIERSTSQSR